MESTRSEWCQQLLITLLPWVLIIGLIVYFSKQMQERMASGGDMFSFGRSKARRFNQERPEIRMDDIAGSENAKRDLNEIADFLRDPERYGSVGADIPRGRALGATEQVPEDRYNMNESYLMDRLGVMLGGREAEKLVFEQVSTGAEQDLKQATKLARRMVLHWGMSDKLGPVAFQDGEEQPFLGREMAQPREYSDATAKVIDDEVRNIVVGMEEKVDEMMRTNRERLKALAEALLDRETLSSGEIEEVLGLAAHN